MVLYNRARALGLTFAFLVLAVVVAARVDAQRRGRRATLRNAGGTVVGEVLFTSVRGGVSVAADVTRLAPGFHGYHIHANNDPANGVGCVPPGFVSADGHFALPGTSHRDHAGDMPLLLAMANGTARGSFVSDRFTLADIVGRAVIVHADSNNYRNIPVGPNPDQYTPNSPAATAATAATGNAGARVLCGVIE